MRLKQFRLKNYRSFTDERTVSFVDINVLIGPNNVGKSNFLRAIELFFSCLESPTSYDYGRDFPRDAEAGRTSMVALFECEDIEGDREILHQYNLLKRRMKQFTPSRNTIQVYLQFSDLGKPTYSLFPGVQIPVMVKMSDDFQVKQEQVITSILEKFFVYYIPADKDLKSIYTKLIIECVKQEISDQIGDFIKDVERQADLISNEINNLLATLGMKDINVFFNVPPVIEDFIAKFDMSVADRSFGELFEKSMGMQWLIIACCIAWLSKSVLRRSGIRCIWLIEEPESYLHPELFAKQRRIFDHIGSHANVIYTTHSIGFVSHDVNRISGVFYDEGKSQIISFPSYEEAIKRIKVGLGVRFSDYFRLADYNVAVEGDADKEYIDWFLQLARRELKDIGHRWPRLLQAEVQGYGGVSVLGGFVRANYRFIRDEVAFVPVFDGDDAGKRETKALRSYLNNHEIPFHAGTEYVLLPNGLPIEGLFPNAYLQEFLRNHPSWFKDHEIDSEGDVVIFALRDENKENYAKTARYKAERDEFAAWSSRWANVCDAIERCLQRKGASLSSAASAGLTERNEIEGAA